MTKLNLKKVRWKNFLSTGNMWTEITLNDYKTNLIIGTNGSGKSTLLDAISFGLFNKPFRKINKPQLVNTITNKDCIVEVEFSINKHNFKVVRGIKPNIFEIYKNDELITQAADNKDYQDAFEKYILKVNHKSFCQVVVLGSAIFTPFMSLPKGNRREIIEDLLDLQIFTTMNNLLKNKIQQTDYDIYTTESEQKIIDEKLKLTYEHIKELQENTEKAIAEKQERIAQANSSIQEYISSLQELKNQINTLNHERNNEDSIRSKYNELSKIQTQLQQKSRQILKEIKFLEENESCPTCQQTIDSSFKGETLRTKSEHYKELEEGLERLETQVEKVQEQINKILVIEDKIVAAEKQISTLEINKDNLYAYISELEADILKAKEIDITDVNRPIELENQLETVKIKLNELNEIRTLQGFAAVMLKDTGIKSRIIKTYIPIINQFIAKYSSILDFFVDFQLNEEFEETIKSRFRDVFSYESFSEGEKMRLNLAILFTWRTIAKMRNSIDCNILIFDEILDSSLDVEGVDNMLRLLQGLTNNENIFIISHKDAILDKFNRVIQFEKTHNFSRITTE